MLPDRTPHLLATPRLAFSVPAPGRPLPAPPAPVDGHVCSPAGHDFRPCCALLMAAHADELPLDLMTPVSARYAPTWS